MLLHKPAELLEDCIPCIFFSRCICATHVIAIAAAPVSNAFLTNCRHPPPPLSTITGLCRVRSVALLHSPRLADPELFRPSERSASRPSLQGLHQGYPPPSPHPPSSSLPRTKIRHSRIYAGMHAHTYPQYGTHCTQRTIASASVWVHDPSHLHYAYAPHTRTCARRRSQGTASPTRYGIRYMARAELAFTDG